MKNHLEGISVIMVDEISTTDHHLFVALNDVLQKAPKDKDKDKEPFGGCNLLLLGDFCQLPPNNSPSLADLPALLTSSRKSWAASNSSDSKVMLQAASLFSEFE